MDCCDILRSSSCDIILLVRKISIEVDIAYWTRTMDFAWPLIKKKKGRIRYFARQRSVLTPVFWHEGKCIRPSLLCS